MPAIHDISTIHGWKAVMRSHGALVRLDRPDRVAQLVPGDKGVVKDHQTCPSTRLLQYRVDFGKKGIVWVYEAEVRTYPPSAIQEPGV